MEAEAGICSFAPRFLSKYLGLPNSLRVVPGLWVTCRELHPPPPKKVKGQEKKIIKIKYN